MCVTEKTSTLLARVPRRVTVTWPQGIRWPQFLKLQFYSPHPPLKEENVGRGVEKEEDVEKKIRKFAENRQSTSSSFSFISPTVSSVSSVIYFSNFVCDDYKRYVGR